MWWSHTLLTLKMGLLLVKDPELPNIPELASPHLRTEGGKATLFSATDKDFFFSSLYKQQVVFLVLS